MMVRRSSRPFARSDAVRRAGEILWRSGTLRTAEIRALGVHPRILYALRDAGELEQIAPGLFRHRDLPPLGNPDLVTIALKVPRGVVCLISALSMHGLTTQLPHEIYVALERGSEPPRLVRPPMRLFWFSGLAFSEGVEVRKADGVDLRVYSAAKTVADCFKFRNKIGLDVAIEGLREYLRRRTGTIDDVWRHARTCRVANVMRPYLEALA